jgi:drug/metabolite transporter (DMT)-like permease
MLSWVAYSVLQQHWSSSLPALTRLASIMIGGVLVLIPFTLLEAWLVPPLPLTTHALTLIVAAAILPGLLSYLAYAFLIRELGATRSSLLLYLGPLYGSLNAWWLLGEVPQWYHLVGAALILPSIWLASRRG